VFHVAITRAQASVVVVGEAGAPSLFVAELTRDAPERPAGSGPESDERPARGLPGSATSGRPGRGAPEIPAAVGLALEWGGYEGEVTEVAADHVALRVGKATFTVAFGSLVKVAGKRRTLGPPGRAAGAASGDQPSADPALFETLKQWRSGRAKADAVPAYVVAKDVTLEAIAARRPLTLAELSTVDGIGPAKLERYGDEILAIVDDAGPPPGREPG